MNFTNDDLKRLKEKLARTDWVVNPKELMALIARLEAAERLIELRGTHIPNALITREIETAVWAWRKASGQ